MAGRITIALCLSPSLINQAEIWMVAGVTLGTGEGMFYLTSADILAASSPATYPVVEDGGGMLLLRPTPIHPFMWAPCRELGHMGLYTARPQARRPSLSQLPRSAYPKEIVSA